MISQIMEGMVFCLLSQCITGEPQLLIPNWIHKIDAHLGCTDSKDSSIKLAFELAKKSVAMNDNNPSVHSLFSLFYLIQGDHEKAVEEGKKAITLGP